MYNVVLILPKFIIYLQMHLQCLAKAMALQRILMNFDFFGSTAVCSILSITKKNQQDFPCDKT